MKKHKELRKLWIVLILYSIAGGIFYNFQELWLLENGLSIKTVGIVLSLCSVLAISIIFLSSNLISRKKLKTFLSCLLLIKGCLLFAFYFLNQTGMVVLIKFFTMLDYVIDVELYTCIYPLMCFIRQDDALYAEQDLAYEGFYNLGIFLTSIFLGKAFFGGSITYNTYCFVAGCLVFIAYFFLRSTSLSSSKEVQTQEDSYDLFSFFRQIKKDTISKFYFLFTFFGEASYACIAEMLMILLTEILGLSPQFSTHFTLGVGVVAVLMGMLILKCFTFKNTFLNLLVKYGGRIFFYSLVFLTGHQLVILGAILYMKMFSDSYVHITDAPYVNRMRKEEQFAFLNLTQMLTYLGTSLGILICSMVIELNVRYVFLAAALLCMIQLFCAYKALQLRKLEKRNGK